jgi:hypothetical protein
MAQVFSSARSSRRGPSENGMILKSVAAGSASVTRLDSIGFGPARSCRIDALVGD